jgi:hypothetical protein
MINQMPIFNQLPNNTSSSAIITVPQATLQRTTSMVMPQAQPIQILPQTQQFQVVQSAQPVQIISGNALNPSAQLIQMNSNTPQVIQSIQPQLIQSIQPQMIQTSPMLQTVQSKSNLPFLDTYISNKYMSSLSVTLYSSACSNACR